MTTLGPKWPSFGNAGDRHILTLPRIGPVDHHPGPTRLWQEDASFEFDLLRIRIAIGIAMWVDHLMLPHIEAEQLIPYSRIGRRRDILDTSRTIGSSSSYACIDAIRKPNSGT